tara:strand:+ start:283 stop:618 length:336 start_codon:yes stop_codon:yes gene_type:complete
MKEFWLIIAFLSGTFSFAFGLAWIIPLLTARMEEMNHEQHNDNSYSSLGILDFFLILIDVIPIFWIIGFIAEAPDTMEAAINKWKEDSMIRICFWSFIGCTSITITSIFMI